MFGLNRDKLRMVLPARLSWLQGVVLWLVILSFVFFGIVAWGMGGGGSTFQSDDSALLADVDGREITRQDFLRRLRDTESNYRDSFGEQAEAFLRSMNVRQQVLNGLISREVAVGEARRTGLRVSPAEVREHIVSTFVDKEGRFVGREALSRYAAQNQYSESEFRTQIADDLLVNKLRDLVATSAIVTDAEVRSEYLRRNDRAKIDYVLLDPAQLAAEETPAEDALGALYQADPQRFAVEERSARYVVFAASEFQGADATDEEVQAVWEREGESRFAGQSQEDASASIRAEIQADKARQAAREMASEAMTKFREGGDLAALGAANARPVRDCGFFAQSSPPAALEGVDGDVTAFARALFSATEVGKFAPFPIPVGEASVILQWLDKRGPIVPPFDAARTTVLHAWRSDRGKVLASELATKLRSALASGTDLTTAAAAVGATLKSSSPFTRTGPVAGIPDSNSLAELAYEVRLGSSQETLVGENAAFFTVVERFELDETKFTEERQAVKTNLEQQRRGEAWETFLAARRHDLETRSKLTMKPLASEMVPSEPGELSF